MTTRPRPERTGLDRLAGTDLRNFRTSRRLLREHGVYELSERVMDVYRAIRDSAQRTTSSRRTDDDVVFATIFLLRSGYAFEKGLVDVMQVHLSDSFGYLRTAIEAAGCVDLVRRDRALARTWLEAADNEARYRLYHDKFRTHWLFPEKDPLMRQIRVIYDWASRTASHGSVYSFATRLAVVQQGTTWRFEYGYQDAKRPEETWRDVLVTFLVHINNHLRLLEIFARALKDVIEKKVWDLHFNTADGLFDQHRDRLAPILTAQRQQQGGFIVPASSLIAAVRPTIWTPGPPRRPSR